MVRAVLLSEAADSENIPQWEKDLQKELQDYEMVNENNDLDDIDIENEILQQIENETDNPWFFSCLTVDFIISETIGYELENASLCAVTC